MDKSVIALTIRLRLRLQHQLRGSRLKTRVKVVVVQTKHGALAIAKVLVAIVLFAPAVLVFVVRKMTGGVGDSVGHFLAGHTKSCRVCWRWLMQFAAAAPITGA
jgi:hypothetical protein